MPLAEFPMPSLSSSNPVPLVFYILPEKFQVGTTKYDDGGMDTKLQAGGTGIKTWVLEYDGMTEALAALLDNHMATAKLADDGSPSAYTFNFRDRDTAILYSGVRYLKYERPAHKKRWVQARSITLVKYP